MELIKIRFLVALTSYLPVRMRFRWLGWVIGLVDWSRGAQKGGQVGKLVASRFGRSIIKSGIKARTAGGLLWE